MSRHRRTRQRPHRATVLSAVFCAVLAAGIYAALEYGAVTVEDCYINSDVRGRWC